VLAHGLHILLGDRAEGVLDESFSINFLVIHQQVKFLGFKFLLDLVEHELNWVHLMAVGGVVDGEDLVLSHQLPHLFVVVTP
jgi:hypothetical protein